MPLGTTAAILLGIGAAGAGVAATSMMSPKAPKENQAAPTPLPQAPDPTESADKAIDSAKKKRMAASQTTYTSPLGISGQASTNRKTLLGE